MMLNTWTRKGALFEIAHVAGCLIDVTSDQLAGAIANIIELVTMIISWSCVICEPIGAEKSDNCV